MDTPTAKVSTQSARRQGSPGRETLSQLSATNASWSQKSWVRQERAQIYAIEAKRGLPFSIAATPALAGMDIEAIPPAALTQVLALEVLRHWKSVGAYELQVVTRACQVLLGGSLPADLAGGLARVCVDEAFHYMMGCEEVARIEADFGVRLAAPALDLPTEKSVAALSRMQVLGAAFVAELTTSVAFSTVPGDESVDLTIRDAIRVHRQDEGRHRVTFRCALAHFWAHATERDRNLLLEGLIDSASELGKPQRADLIHWKRQLALFADRSTVAARLSMLSRPTALVDAAKQSGLTTELGRAGLLSDAQAADRLERAGITARSDRIESSTVS